jgi:hypothetical protein
MLITPFDRLSLPAEQGLWQAGVNGVYIEIIDFSVLLSLSKHDPFLRLCSGHSEKNRLP